MRGKEGKLTNPRKVVFDPCQPKDKPGLYRPLFVTLDFLANIMPPTSPFPLRLLLPICYLVLTHAHLKDPPRRKKPPVSRGFEMVAKPRFELGTHGL